MALTKVTSNVITDNSVGITQLNVSDGSNGQFLKTDGSGNLSFATAGGGVDGIVSSADATAITINSSEQVGIGTTNPTAPLHVIGNAVVTGNIISTGDTNIIYDSDDSCIFSRANGSETMRLASDGSVGIGTTDTSNAKLVFNGAISSGSDTPMIDFDGFGTRGDGSSQSINFRMGRAGQATDQAAQIRSIFQGGGATAGQTNIGFEFRCISSNVVDTTVRFSGTGQRIQFNTDEIPQSSNPITNQAIVIGPSSSGAVTQGLTNATVLQNRSGELFAIDSSHNNTQITPHNWGLISSGPSEELAWTYYSQRPNPSNNDQMQTINVDMAKVIRKVEDLVGEKLIYTENSEKDGHTFQSIISDIQTTLADLKTRVETLEG